MQHGIIRIEKRELSFDDLVKAGVSKSFRPEYNYFTKWLHERKLERNADTIREYLYSEQRDGKMPATLQNKKSFLKAWVIKESLHKDANYHQQIEDFFKAIKLPKPDKQLGSHKFLTDAEIDTLSKYAGKKMRLIIKTLQQSGCRISELTSIRLKSCEERVNTVSMRIVGKGNKSRTVHITLGLFEEIRECFQGNIRLFESKSSRPLDKRNLYHEIRRIGLKAAERTTDRRLAAKFKKITLHNLRHSFASNCLANKVDIFSLKNILGHSFLATTERYLHHSPKPELVLERFL